MSTLKTAVTEGLNGQGVAVLEDRGGLSVRDLDPELPISIWVDETERVIRAEAPLCYPIDDFSPDLSMALDHLNRARSGVNFSYREANRALVVSCSWTSPNRSPSSNQLHLLMALLLQAKDRDGPQLWRVAEGDAGWDEVIDQEDLNRQPTQTLRFSDTSGESTGGTGKFRRGASGGFDRPAGPGATGTETTRWTELMNIADGEKPGTSSKKWRNESAAGGMSGGSDRPRTRRNARPPAGGGLDALDEMPTRKLDQLDEEEGRYDGATPRRLSRHALHVAVSAKENETHARQDMTRSYSRRGGGLLKWVVILGLLGGVAFALASYYENITGHSLLPDIASWFQDATMSDGERQLLAREAIPAGEELLVAELQDPLPGDAHTLMIEKALKALGDEAGGTIEGLLARSPSSAVRKRAYELWQLEGLDSTEGATLRVLKLMSEAKTASSESSILVGLLGALRSSPPEDELVVGALDWATDDMWLCLVEILGRPGPGSEARAAALQLQLSKDTDDKQVLQALVKTGHPPGRAAADLVLANGAKWAVGPGRTLLLNLAERDVNMVEPLLGVESTEIRQVAIELLVASGLRDGIPLLVRVMRTDVDPQIRIRAVRALGELNVPEAIWPLALEINRSTEDELELKIQDEVLKILQRMPEGDVVGQIELHLAPERELKERVWSVSSLGQLQKPAAVMVLLETGLRDPDERIRRRVLKILGEQQAASRTTLQRGLSVLRDVARNDESEVVRAAADKLYQTLIRR